jgi:hypothetical protein
MQTNQELYFADANQNYIALTTFNADGSTSQILLKFLEYLRRQSMQMDRRTGGSFPLCVHFMYFRPSLLPNSKEAWK